MGAVMTTSFVFGLTHYKGGETFIFLSSLAGIAYGYAYLKSQRLEGSILIHFLVNLIHIIFFSYPSLMR